MLSVTSKPYMLSVATLNVVMLGVVARGAYYPRWEQMKEGAPLG
jgi:hypothetical protein